MELLCIACHKINGKILSPGMVPGVIIVPVIMPVYAVNQYYSAFQMTSYYTF